MLETHSETGRFQTDKLLPLPQACESKNLIKKVMLSKELLLTPQWSTSYARHSYPGGIFIIRYANLHHLKKCK